eukprot:TRINITY_DN52774_c0_g1_i1.p1 TRINITY_DN52774_c0_g1~~TRINITY_DN52774_c0_g1_i1.p1  ORF type:complete len:203 (-),score=62.74 TRINITY_DN52774_c0_g1_i1:38-646(-)
MCIRDRSTWGLELEENSIQKKDYQTLITIDPADLINELAQKENTCTEIINMTEFLMERNKTLEEQVESLLTKSKELELNNSIYRNAMEEAQEELEAKDRDLQDQLDEADKAEEEKKKLLRQLEQFEQKNNALLADIQLANEEIILFKDSFEKEQRANSRLKQENEKHLRDSKELSKLLENTCLLYTSPSPRDLSTSRMPSSA